VEKLLSIIGTCRHNTILCYYAVGCIWNFASTGSFFLFLSQELAVVTMMSMTMMTKTTMLMPPNGCGGV
jgi:hypothetical protein